MKWSHPYRDSVPSFYGWDSGKTAEILGCSNRALPRYLYSCTVQYSTVQYSTVQCSAVQCRMQTTNGNTAEQIIFATTALNNGQIMLN
jgi:hypothetical protein